MASDLIDPATIADGPPQERRELDPSVDREEVGRVIETGDGIARVAGLPRTMANELLEFPGGLLGVAFNLDEDEIGCIIFGEAADIEEGDPVKQTGRILSVPVGDGFLGRVVDALGRPLDGKGAIAEDRDPEPRAPGAERGVAPAGEGAALHRDHRDRRDDRDRPRPAPADHRRPPDRQDRRRARHDHQPEAVLGDRPGRASASTSRSGRRPRPSPRSSRPSARTARSSTRSS